MCLAMHDKETGLARAERPGEESARSPNARRDLGNSRVPSPPREWTQRQTAGSTQMRKVIAITLIALAAVASGASATEPPIRPHQAHARVVAQAARPMHWCYCG